LAHHFLDYVHFCVRCARCMRKFAPTNTFKTPSKSFKTTTKTRIKRIQKPSNAYKSQKTESLCFFNVLGNMQKNMENLGLLLLFCRVLTESCFWKKHGHDCKFEHCACVCTSPCGLGCTTYFVRDHLKPGFFHERNL
jgi:hypothetical protein